jgi:hypothetical protein
MRLEIEKPLVLALERSQQRQECHVLVHVRKVSGVVGVEVLHAGGNIMTRNPTVCVYLGMITTRLISLAVAGLVACAACATEEPATPKRPPIREYDSVTPAQPPPAATSVALPQGLLDALRADAAKRASVAADEVTVASAEKVTWNDGAMGCPQPGRSYMQALVPGYRVFMRAGERVLLYHTSESGQLVLCPRVGLRPVDPTSPVAQ